MNRQARRKNVTFLVRRLVDALADRGLSAKPFGATMAWVSKPAADTPDGESPGPGMRHAVLCRRDGDGEWIWWWVRVEGGDVLQHERLCAASEITTAADAIVRLLAAGERAGSRR